METTVVLFLSNLSKSFMSTCRIAASYSYSSRIVKVWWLKFFAFDPGKNLRWVTPTFSRLFNFFICDVFKMLAEIITIFFGLLLPLIADDVYLVKLLLFTRRYDWFFLFTSCSLLFVVVMYIAVSRAILKPVYRFGIPQIPKFSKR